MIKHFTDNDWKKYIPIPICEDFPEYRSFYDKAWELAHEHLKYIDKMPQNPYMDEAFCDTQLWIWDSCFMSLFCKFAPKAFPGVETLQNFYQVLYDGIKLPKIFTTEKEPAWTNAIAGRENDILIHIADNPPLFAWAEYENAMISGDIEHIKFLLYEKQYLQKHYAWIDSLKEPEHLQGVCLPTFLIKEDIGYRWEGACSGMDNTPRGRKKVREGKERPNNPDMLWIDAICQQALTAKMISMLFKVVGDINAEEKWNKEYLTKKNLVNQYYWDDEDKFYYDIDVNTYDFYKVMTVASFWPLVAEIASKQQAEALVSHLSNPNTFGGEVPLVSLARNDGDYYADGRYWRGALWLPTAYAALKGFSNYGFDEEVHNAAHKILTHMLNTYIEYEPHTIWECYSPEECSPALTVDGSEVVRPDFCGWSALGPISIYIEFILGFRKIDAFENKVEWVIPQKIKKEIGIKNLQFGDIVTDIIVKDGVCSVNSNAPFTLEINNKGYGVNAGQNTFKI